MSHGRGLECEQAARRMRGKAANSDAWRHEGESRRLDGRNVGKG